MNFKQQLNLCWLYEENEYWRIFYWKSKEKCAMSALKHKYDYFIFLPFILFTPVYFLLLRVYTLSFKQKQNKTLFYVVRNSSFKIKSIFFFKKNNFKYNCLKVFENKNEGACEYGWKYKTSWRYECQNHHNFITRFVSCLEEKITIICIISSFFVQFLTFFKPQMDESGFKRIWFLW
jgi:hypothetical protein